MKYITPMSFFPFYKPEKRTFPSSNISRMSGEVRAPQNKQNLSETYSISAMRLQKILYACTTDGRTLSATVVT